jgi:hypothetical protein
MNDWFEYKDAYSQDSERISALEDKCDQYKTLLDQSELARVELDALMLKTIDERDALKWLPNPEDYYPASAAHRAGFAACLDMILKAREKT